MALVRRLIGRLRWRMANLNGSSADTEIGRRVGERFDADFYRTDNPDVAALGIDPLAHFLDYGWREGRDPRADFSLSGYRELNPHLSAEVNPFVDFVLTGGGEGRARRTDLGFRHDMITLREPMAARLADRGGEPVAVLPAERLVESMSANRSALADLHLSVSHDNYLDHMGGVQLCLQREARALAEAGVDHLHLFPATSWPMVRSGRDAGPLGVIWNGTMVGCFEPGVVAAALGGLPQGGRSLALHNLLGHSTTDILEILGAARLQSGFFWLHDFASLCAGFHLMRNDVTDCGAPLADSGACSICLYGPYRAFHVAEHRRLFEALKLTVVAPSQTTLDLWHRASDLPHVGEIVAPHARLGAVRPGPEPRPGPLRVAFVGVGAMHKGWPVFEDLVMRFRHDPRYDFIHLGRKGVHDLPAAFDEVSVAADRPTAMRDALEAHAVDIALVWPLCRETFSFTAYEAAAAGAAVLTHPDSGNVAAFVAEGGHGRVLADEAALVALFESGEALALSRAVRRPELRELTFGALTAELRAGPEARSSSARR